MERNRTVSNRSDAPSDAPLIAYDPPNNDGGDVTMQNIDDTTYSPPMVTSPDIIDIKSGTYVSLSSSTSTFGVEDGSYHNKHHHNAKRFDHHEARKTLLVAGATRLLITVLFSAAMCITLKSWEGFRGKGTVVLSRIDVRIFNALTIGLSLCLGLNILASLKHYASVFRWLFLARRYVSLEVFDLILHLSSLAKVTKLMIISSPGFRGRRWLRKFGWFKDVRDDGTQWMWLVCLLWLCINIGSQILIALLSLFWPMENSGLPLFIPGDVMVADLRTFYVGNNTFNPDPEGESTRLQNETSLEAAWQFGMEAMSYPEFSISSIQGDLSGLAGTPIYKGDGAYHYRFFNREPARLYTNYLVSSRNVTATATCSQLEVRSPNATYDDEGAIYLEARPSGQTEWDQFYMMEVSSGSITWMAYVPEHCGPRCTHFTVLQYRDENKIANTSLFSCNNTLHEVSPSYAVNDITLYSKEDAEAVYGSDAFARSAAGAIGWTGIPWNQWYDRQARSYSQGSKWSPPHHVSIQEVEDLLARFTIGAVAAFDDHGIRYNLTHQTVVPSKGQQLDVEWKYIFSILGGICGIQFLALCLLVLFANRTIVRDDSYFSVAMLLNPVVGRLGKQGMNMSGDEIKLSRALQWKKIKYAYREGTGGAPNKVDIFFEGRDDREGRKSWAQGSYS
jgi:hypothetical protein